MKKYWFVILIILLLLLLFMALAKTAPQVFYGESLEYENYKIYARTEIDSAIIEVLKDLKRQSEEGILNFDQGQYRVFLCNSTSLFWMHTFLGKKPTGASDLITNNIYIANAKVPEGLACSSAKSDTLMCRDLSGTIAHEATHIWLRDEIGLLAYRKYLMTDLWKIEGICEYVGINDSNLGKEESLEIYQNGSHQYNPYHLYRLYHQAIIYLVEKKGMGYKEILTSDHQFESVLEVWHKSLSNE